MDGASPFELVVTISYIYSRHPRYFSMACMRVHDGFIEANCIDGSPQ